MSRHSVGEDGAHPERATGTSRGAVLNEKVGQEVSEECGLGYVYLKDRRKAVIIIISVPICLGPICAKKYAPYTFFPLNYTASASQLFYL